MAFGVCDGGASRCEAASLCSFVIVRGKSYKSQEGREGKETHSWELVMPICSPPTFFLMIGWGYARVGLWRDDTTLPVFVREWEVGWAVFRSWLVKNSALRFVLRMVFVNFATKCGNESVEAR